jgi:putative membrane protein
MMNAIANVLIADTWGMHDGDVGWGWMMIPMVLFWGAVILGIVWLVRHSSGDPRETPQQARMPTATEILERRFAEGTISVDEYRERREVIANGAGQTNGDHEREPAPTAGEGRT